MRYEVTDPEGNRFEINAPEGATQAQVLEYARTHGKPKSPVTPPSRVGAFSRGTSAGIAGLLGMPVDTVENAVNLGIAGFGVGTGTKPDLLQGSVGGSEWIRKRMERLGVRTTDPQPDDPLSRLNFSAGRIAGGSVLPGAGVRQTAIASLGGGLASAIDPRLEGIGALSPAALERRPILSPRRQTLEAFKESGTTPSVGQVTGSPFYQGLENFLARAPGGGPLQQFKQLQQTQIGKTVPEGSAEQAGRTIERGTKDFLSRTNATWRALDQSMAAVVGNRAVVPQNTITKLNELTTTLSKAESQFVNARLQQIKQDLAEDLELQSGQLSFDAVRGLRSRIGQLVDDSLVVGIPAGEMKGLYGALSEDMRLAAESAGPAGLQAWKRQNDYYRARMDRVEGALQRVLGNNRMPEEIFAATAPKNIEQVNVLRQVMRSLKTDEREVVTRAVVGRLGRATPGRQDETGEMFSTDQFLTNWNKLSTGAKAQLFPDEAMRSHLAIVANASARIKKAGQVGQNYSGTAGNIVQAGLYGGAGIGAFTGNAWAIPAAAGAIGTVNMGSRLLTNPKFVRWLANSTVISPKNAGTHMARLAVIYNTADEETKRDLEQYAQSLGAAR